MRIPFTEIEIFKYNLLSCGGFENSVNMAIGSVGFGGGDCTNAKLVLVFLFFLVAIVRKWGGEEIGFDFSFMWGLIGCLVSYIITISLFGNIKIAFIVSIIFLVIFGYGSSYIFGEE
jgi:hypothetical protein